MIKILLCLLVLFGVVDARDDVAPLLRGNHELRSFNVKTKTSNEWSASYFLVLGGASGSTTTETYIRFAWKNNNDEYVISNISINKIRIKIDNTIDKPYVKFRWKSAYLSHSDMEYIIRCKVIYMVVVCKEEDYPINIDLSKL